MHEPDDYIHQRAAEIDDPYPPLCSAIKALLAEDQLSLLDILNSSGQALRLEDVLVPMIAAADLLEKRRKTIEMLEERVQRLKAELAELQSQVDALPNLVKRAVLEGKLKGIQAGQEAFARLQESRELRKDREDSDA